MRILIALAVVGAAGCATPAWHNPSKTQAQFSQDRYTCMQQRALLDPVGVHPELFDACMGAAGWVWK